MEWTKLDIRKASVLKKQVDLALLTLKQSILEGELARRTALINSFVAEVDVIEEFRANNDSDERSILFERERLRLRKAVQEALSANPSDNVNRPSSNTSQIPTTTPGDNVFQFSNKNNTSSTKQQQPIINSPDRPRGAASNASLRVEQTIRAGNQISSPSKKIYDWEDGGSSKVRSEIDIDECIFYPAEEDGIYIRDNLVIGTEGGGEMKTIMNDPQDINGITTRNDVYFVLTADEINILASRLQHKKNTDKTVFKNRGSNSGVQHSTPYVEPSRITKGLLRPEQKNKWIDTKSIRPNAK
jgi:hypothetical protein